MSAKFAFMCRTAGKRRVLVKLRDCHRALNMDIHCVQGTWCCPGEMRTHGTGFSVYTSPYKCIGLKNNYDILYATARMCSISKLTDRF
jgi:hypothetical protein